MQHGVTARCKSQEKNCSLLLLLLLCDCPKLELIIVPAVKKSDKEDKWKRQCDATGQTRLCAARSGTAATRHQKALRYLSPRYRRRQRPGSRDLPGSSPVHAADWGR